MTRYSACVKAGERVVSAQKCSSRLGFGSSIPTKWRASYDQGIGDKSRGRKMARLGSQAGDFLNEYVLNERKSFPALCDYTRSLITLSNVSCSLMSSAWRSCSSLVRSF